MTPQHSDCQGCDHLAEALRLALRPNYAAWVACAFLAGYVFHAYVLPVVGRLAR